MSVAANRNTRGFTVFELLVVVFVVGLVVVLVGLMASAVSRMREAANRVQCSSYLKQMGLGMHNFEGVHKRLPPLMGGGTDPNGLPVAELSGQFPRWNGATPFFLLPYIEQHELWKAAMAADPANEPPLAVPSRLHKGRQVNQSAVITFVCLVDPGMVDGIQRGSGLGGMSFVANGQLFGNTDPATGLPSKDNPWDRGSRVSGIKDGSSNTIAFAHAYVRCGAADGTATTPASGAIWGYYYNGFAPAGTQGPPIFMCADVNGAANVGPGIGLHFQVTPFPFAALAGNGAGCDPGLPATPHLDCMIVSLADGSTRSVLPIMSLRTWWLACSPDDGQPMPNDW